MTTDNLVVAETLPDEVKTALAARIRTVEQMVAEAAVRSGREPSDIAIVAVSKTVDRAHVLAAYELGLRAFGENRVQDATRRYAAPLPDDLQLHLIGQLQSNKARAALKLCHVIESVDRASLIETLAAEAKKLRERGELRSTTRVPVLLQVNIASEPQKAGCHPADVPQLLELALATEQLDVRGLMAMAPLMTDLEATRPVFRALSDLRENVRVRYPELSLPTLSMGMSNDFPIAIEEGATHVRIGRALFEHS